MFPWALTAPWTSLATSNILAQRSRGRCFWYQLLILLDDSSLSWPADTGALGAWPETLHTDLVLGCLSLLFSANQNPAKPSNPIGQAVPHPKPLHHRKGPCFLWGLCSWRKWAYQLRAQTWTHRVWVQTQDLQGAGDTVSAHKPLLEWRSAERRDETNKMTLVSSKQIHSSAIHWTSTVCTAPNQAWRRLQERGHCQV